MTITRALCFSLAILACSSAASAQAPANDDCSNASVVSTGLTPFDSTLATDGAGLALDPNVCDVGMFGDEQLYQDVWFSFTPMVSASFDVASVANGNPSFDSRLAIYDSSACPADPALVIACDDDSGPGTEAAVSQVPMNMGSTYTVRVGSYNSTTAEQPAALSITQAVIPTAPANDDCAGALTVTLGQTMFDTTVATDGSGLALDPLVCSLGANDQVFQDIWFLFTPTTNDAFDFAVVDPNTPAYDSKLVVYNQSTCPDDPANVIACDDDGGPGFRAEITGLSLNMGTTYLVRVGSYGANTAEQPAVLEITVGVPVIAPVNDDCANAIVIPAQGTTQFDNTFASTDGADLTGFCDLGAFGDENVHNDVWFTFTPTVDECTYISSFGLAGFDTRMAIYSSPTCPDDPATIVACSDDEQQPPTGPFEAGLDVDLIAGTTYLIRIGSFSATTTGGPGAFTITPGPLAVLNDFGQQPGAPGCAPGPVFGDFCNGDGGDQMGCSDCPCGNETTAGTIGGCLNGSFRSAKLTATGDPSVSLPSGDTTDMRFSLVGAQSNVFSVLTSGDNLAPDSMANPCFGLGSGEVSAQLDGLRCITSNALNHGGRMTDTNGEVGNTNAPWGGEGAPAAGVAGAGSGFAAGQTRYFQVVYRTDSFAVCGRGLNSSQAVEVAFLP